MPDSMQLPAPLVSRLNALERRVRPLQATLVAIALAAGAGSVAAFTARPPMLPSADIIRARRLVLVDGEGKPGATIELGPSAAPGISQAPPESPAPASLQIHVEGPLSDSAPGAIHRPGAQLELSARALSINFGPIEQRLSSGPPRESGMLLQPGPTLALMRGDQSVYRIDPNPGAGRPVSIGDAFR
jgi:hypothetical protein